MRCLRKQLRGKNSAASRRGSQLFGLQTLAAETWKASFSLLVAGRQWFATSLPRHRTLDRGAAAGSVRKAEQSAQSSMRPVAVGAVLLLSWGSSHGLYDGLASPNPIADASARVNFDTASSSELKSCRPIGMTA
jgi:hypothetical protein